MIPLPHQQRFVDANPDKAILNWEMRVGKSLPAAIWIDHPSRGNNTYIVTKKSNKRSWQEFNTRATVLTKEEFKKADIQNPTAIVFDEAHHASAPLFIKSKKRSALAVKFYQLCKKYPDMHVLLLTATPLRQDAWSFHTLLCFIGVYYDWKEWREQFFDLKEERFLARPKWMSKHEVPKAWFRKDNWRELIDPLVRQYTDVVALSEVVDSLPPVSSRIITIKQPPYKKPLTSSVTWVDEHKWEQQNKHKEILELGYKKLIIVAKYTSQIDELAKKLKDEKPVYILDGRTKNQEATIKEAQEAKECYLIVQSLCGEGWDGYMFGGMVFASMDHSYVANVQMHGRQRHPKYLRDIEIIYLLGGRWDEKILEAYNNAEDFNPHKYAVA